MKIWIVIFDDEPPGAFVSLEALDRYLVSVGKLPLEREMIEAATYGVSCEIDQESFYIDDYMRGELVTLNE